VYIKETAQARVSEFLRDADTQRLVEETIAKQRYSRHVLLRVAALLASIGF
jgi:hypothetical protein